MIGIVHMIELDEYFGHTKNRIHRIAIDIQLTHVYIQTEGLKMGLIQCAWNDSDLHHINMVFGMVEVFVELHHMNDSGLQNCSKAISFPYFHFLSSKQSPSFGLSPRNR